MRPSGDDMRRRCVASLWASGLVALACGPLAAQSGAMVVGVVRSAEEGEAIGGVEVRAEALAAATLTDSAGRYVLRGVPPGPQVIRAERLGFASARHHVTLVAGRTHRLDFALSRSALKVEGITVTADPASRARGELATASVLEEEALRVQPAASVAGVLSLTPGFALEPPGLEGVQQASLRAAPTTGSAGGGAGVSDLASLGTLIVLDGVPVSNDANLQSAGARSGLAFATSSGGGVDLRRIPAALIERVEVIRGVPSARYGDLTQGAIVVDTRAGVVAPEVVGKLDARTWEASAFGGRRLAGDHTATLTLDFARTASSPGLTDDVTDRAAGQLAHRYAPDGGSFSLDTRVDYFLLDDDRPEDPDTRPDFASRTVERGVRVSHRLDRALIGEARLSVALAFSAQEQDTHARRPRSVVAVPITQRLDEGRSEGTFLAGNYISELDVLGAPRSFFARAELDSPLAWLGAHRVRGGIELRREWNAGAGRMFDMLRPPFSRFDGVRGYDRPHAFDSIPPLVTAAYYLDDQLRTSLPGGLGLNVQLGVRADVLATGAHWLTAARDLVVQPRLNAELQISDLVRLRGGAGRVAKSPVLGMQHPAVEYFDLVNVNWYANEEAERLAVITTRILDPRNPELRYARGTKAEVGIEVGRGDAVASLVAFDDGIRGGVGFERVPVRLYRDRYELTDSVTGNGVPPEIIEPPVGTDTVPALLSVPRNLYDVRNRGLELSATLPEVRWIRTRFGVQASWVRTERSADALYFGRTSELEDLQQRAVRRRIPYWRAPEEEGERALAIYRAVHHQPEVGLVITAAVQHNIRDMMRDIAATDTLAFEGYLTKAGELVAVPPERRSDPEFADLRAIPRSGAFTERQSAPADWLAMLQVAKTLPLDGRLSFWMFNVLDDLGSFAEREVQGRSYPQMRFGLDVSFPVGPRP